MKNRWSSTGEPLTVRIPITKPYLGEEEKQLVSEVIESGWISQGPKVAEFEDRFARAVGAKFAVATTSCTTALHAALSASGIGAGEEVLVPSLSFIATANAVLHSGATPVFIDIDPETCNIDINKIEQAVTERTSAIMPVHQMGLAADIDPIKKIAEKNALLIVEDAACAIGSEYKGKRIGGHGNTACFSLHPRKIITTGEGGMITTDDPELAAKLRRLRHHGMSVSDLERHSAERVVIERYPEIGYNYRMTDMQAAMGIVQLNRLPYLIKERRELAMRYDSELDGNSHIRVPEVPSYAFHNYQSYWIEILQSSPLKRDMLMTELLKKGIATRRGIMAIHREESYSGHGISLPETERISDNTLLLPLYPSLTHEEQAYVIQCLKEILP